MKKTALCFLLVVFLAVQFCGCSQEFSNAASNASTNEIDNTKITYIYEDWPYYSSIESLVDYADNVFEGKVTNISFAVLDMRTGKSVSIKDKDADPFLYTIYEVEITNLYKGENTSKSYIKVAGGVPEYKEDEQLKAMRKSGILDERIGITVVENTEPLNIGDTYFFFTKNGKTKYQNIVNNIQFAYNSEETEQSTEFTYENIKEYADKYRELQMALGDSVNISDEIKQILEVQPYLDTVYKFYNIDLNRAFVKADNIDAVFEQGSYVFGEYYVVQTIDNKFISNGIVDNTVFYSTESDVLIDPNALRELQEGKAILQLSPDVEIYARYYLTGETSYSGSAVYYKTNKGDYVYYRDYRVYDHDRERYETGNFLFTIKEFCELQRTVYDKRREEAKRNPDADGGAGSLSVKQKGGTK